MRSLPKKKIPDGPGVYFFKKGRKTLYIGKATSLRDRVRSYLQTGIETVRSPIIARMVDEATGLAWTETDSVLEALILEAALIKKHQPHYNTREKSDKSFNYVVVTKEEFPRVFTVREREMHTVPKEYKYVYGPFPHGTQLKEALKIVRKIFPYRGENDAPTPSDRKRVSRLYEELGLAPNLADEGKREYARTIRNLDLFFRGKKSELIRVLERDMKRFAKNREFERADEVKRQLYALKHIQDVALIKVTESPGKSVARIEAYDVAHLSETNRVGVMTVVEAGEAMRRDYRTFNIKGTNSRGDTGALAEMLERRLGHPEWRMPRLIVVDGAKAQINTAERTLKRFGVGIPVVAVTKNERHRPERIVGDKKLITEYERDILLANHEAHRFAIAFHRKKRARQGF